MKTEQTANQKGEALGMHFYAYLVNVVTLGTDGKLHDVSIHDLFLSSAILGKMNF